MKGLVLLNQGFRDSMTPDNSGISRSFNEGAVLMVYQKPEAVKQTKLLITMNIYK